MRRGTTKHWNKTMAITRDDNTRLTYDIVAWILAGVALLLILSLHLLRRSWPGC
jgi:hypothetical protein